MTATAEATIDAILELPVLQRIEVAHAILESIAADTARPPLTEELKKELIRRRDEARAHPERDIPREEVEAAALARVTADTNGEGMDAEVREELDRRVAAYRANPSAAKPWDAVKASLRSRS